MPLNYSDRACLQAVKNWFQNHKHDVLPPEDGDDDAEAAPGIKASTKNHNLLLVNMKSRASSAQSLWAKANHELVEQVRDGGDIGKRQKVVAELFAKLPVEEQEMWKSKAFELKEGRLKNADQCFE